MADNEMNLTYEESMDTMETHKILQRYIPIVVVNIIVIGILAYFISPLSKVDSISVEGTQVVYDQEVINQSGLRSGETVLQVMGSFDAVEKELEANIPQVADASVYLNGINEIVVNIKEYSTVAYIAQDESYLRVLENGTVLDDEFAVSIGNQPVLSKFKEGETLNMMIAEISKLNLPILNLISEIELVESRSNPLFIRVYMNNGNRILSTIPTFSEKISYYPQMVQAVEGRKGIFDMEAGVYFIPFIDGESEDSGIDEEERQALEGFNG